MSNNVKILCENSGKEMYITQGTSLEDLLLIANIKNEYGFIACYVNNKLKELSFKIYNPASVRFIDITHYEGIRVYQRTLTFILEKAVKDLYGKSLKVKHAVSKGFYCEIEGLNHLDHEQIEQIKLRMKELIDLNIPIVRETIPTSEAEQIYYKEGYHDKLALLHSRKRLYSTIYSLTDSIGYFYGALAISTGILKLFDLRSYYNGIYLATPKRSNPAELEPMVTQDKMFDIFEEYKAWVEVMGVSTVGEFNEKVIGGHASEMIKIAEAFHEKKLSHIADMIQKSKEQRGVMVVLISGPSSSGKTTFAKRLGIQLRIVGLNPELISLDDYFVDREKTPRDPDGDYDYEALEAIDIKTFNKHLKQLLAGESVDIPRYDFITGSRQWHEKPLQLGDRGILVIEGIHGLNPKLTAELEERFKFKVYISALTSISMDNMSRIPTTDNRLLRRIVRDYTARGSNALSTIKRWGSVRKGEDRHIFPYQENADVMFNSSMFYELSVLKRFAEPMLHEVPNTEPEFGEARRLLKFIDNFIPVNPDEIPPTSILREFVGGSSFKY